MVKQFVATGCSTTRTNSFPLAAVGFKILTTAVSACIPIIIVIGIISHANRIMRQSLSSKRAVKVDSIFCFARNK